MKLAIITESLNTHSGSRAPLELALNLPKSIKLQIFSFDLNLDREIIELCKNNSIPVSIFPGRSFSQKLRSIPSLTKSISKGKFDLLSFHGTLPTFIAAKLTGTPIIKTYYGTQFHGYLERFLPNEQPNIIHKVINLFGNFLIFLSDFIQFQFSQKQISISRYTSTEAKKLYKKEIPYIYLGSNPHTLKAKNQQPAAKNLELLSVSRITPYKGFHLLTKTVKQVEVKLKKPIHFTIVISGKNQRYLNYLKKIKSPNTEIIENINDKELSILYRSCNIYLTADRYLFFGMPPLEAAQFGKPTIAFDNCAAREIILDGKTGFVVQDQKKFKERLIALLTNPPLSQSLGRNAKQYAQTNFKWKNCAKKYRTFLENYLNFHIKSLE